MKIKRTIKKTVHGFDYIRPRCSYIKNDGHQCGNIKNKDSDFCTIHNEKITRDREEKITIPLSEYNGLLAEISLLKYHAGNLAKQLGFSDLDRMRVIPLFKNHVLSPINLVKTDECTITTYKDNKVESFRVIRR